MPGEESPWDRRKRIARQSTLFLGAGWVYLSVGMTLTWPNVLAADLTSSNATLLGTQLSLSMEQLDMVGSLMFVGSVPGFLVSGWLVRCVGRRWSMVCAALPGLFGSVMLALAPNAALVLTARFLEGATFGMVGVAVRTYIIEVADTEIRGSAAVVVNLMMQIGSCLVVTLGLPLPWYVVSFFSSALSIIYCLLIVPFLPESPTFLVITGQTEKARDLLARLRGPSVNVDKLMDDILEQNRGVGDGQGWQFLLKKDVLMSEVTLFILFLISNFTGVQVLKANTVRILQESSPGHTTALAMEGEGLLLEDEEFTLGKEVSTILVTVVLFCGNFVMLLLLDRLGRRGCLVLSFAFILAAYGVLGAYIHLSERREYAMIDLARDVDLAERSQDSVLSLWSWVPLACLLVAALGQSMGSGPVPWILSPEYFPTTIRSQAMCVCTLTGSLQAFAVLQLFSPMQQWLTKAGLYWCYAAAAALGIPYTLLVIRETKGKAVG